ncbi:solute carrier organic anion transporter family member 2B1-like [Pomacea canaliculata]|uniref:solute carrier organic anion transporter family member 2B1-like n=1 Tax=Pomacea canaliculata TaxID=400727 RepID=UPI000D7378DF|nr:solute carrier organic anion transporter family member 2B1-like [Pomacea canaliculata]
MSVPQSTQSSRQSFQSFVSSSYRRASTNPDSDYVPECGIGSCKPEALRFCANVTSFTGYFSICSLLTMTLTSYVTSQVTTLERHFGFSSSETGLIMAANDVGFLIVILFVSHAATKVHIPRALGGATILFGISGILCALPMFIFGAPSPSLNGTSGSATSTASKSFYGQLCEPHPLGGNELLDDCEVTGVENGTSSDLARDISMKSNSQAALAIIVLGMLLQGVAKSPRSPFTTVYVDGNVEKEKTGFYMGIITTITIMGPALAYGLGGVFSRIYVTLQDTDLSPRHPRWIGAWWLGYVIFGSASILFSFPLFLFPRWIKERHLSDDQTSSQQPTEPKTSRKLVILNIIKEFLRSLKRLLLNPVYDCVVVASCIPMFASSGAASFGPKYMENLFSLPAWKANIATAGILLGTICLGTLVGGWLTKRLKMGPVEALKFVIGVEVTALAMSIPLIFLHCPQPLIFNSPGPRAAFDEATVGCFETCACDDDDFLPVCGSDMRTYYSPCHAGCIISSGSKYSNCSCITGG